MSGSRSAIHEQQGEAIKSFANITRILCLFAVKTHQRHNTLSSLVHPPLFCKDTAAPVILLVNRNRKNNPEQFMSLRVRFVFVSVNDPIYGFTMFFHRNNRQHTKTTERERERGSRANAKGPALLLNPISSPQNGIDRSISVGARHGTPYRRLNMSRRRRNRGYLDKV